MCSRASGGAPSAQPGEKAALDKELTLQELTTAVEQLASGRAPGIDGLPIEFYKRFWDCLGEDFHMVMLECFNTGRLPSSCRRAVLSLLPKKGTWLFLRIGDLWLFCVPTTKCSQGHFQID